MNRNQATFPSLKRRGGCGINKKSGSHRSAADGVVRSAKVFRPKNFAGLTTFKASRYRARASRPSARTKVASRYFLDRASTPPFQGGEYTRPNIHSHLLQRCLVKSRILRDFVKKLLA